MLAFSHAVCVSVDPTATALGSPVISLVIKTFALSPFQEVRCFSLQVAS